MRRLLLGLLLVILGALGALFIIGVINGLVVGLLLFAQIVSDLAHGY